MKKVLKLLVTKFAITDFDWMNFRITKENPLTFHHIKKVSQGGEETLDNGAPLTRYAQEYLHLMESYNFKIYRRLNRILAEINEQGFVPTPRQQQKIELLLLEFEARYYEQLKSRQGISKYDKYNATLERKRVQEGKVSKSKKKQIVRKSKKRN